MSELSCEASSWSLRVDPERGGCITRLRWRDHPVLRDAVGQGWLESAAFPTLPFFGRLPSGVLSDDGREVNLPANLASEPQPIHGLCWQRPWQVVDHETDLVLLEREHDGTGWPWRYRSTQAMALAPNRFELRIALTNLDEVPMPAGIGWHPFFPSADVQLRFAERTEPADALQMDDVFAAPSRSPELHLPGVVAALDAASPFSRWVIYRPAGAAFICVEPITHAPGDFSTRLAPGETLSAVVRINVERATR